MNFNKFTKREREVLKMIVFPNKEIAKRLGVSPSTVMTHVTALRTKLLAVSKIQILAEALKQKKIDIEEIVTK